MDIMWEIRECIVNDTVDRMTSVMENDGVCDETECHIDECVRWFIEDLQQYLVQHVDDIKIAVEERLRGE